MSKKKWEEWEKVREVGKEKFSKSLTKYHLDPFAGPCATGNSMSRRTEEELHSYGFILEEGVISIAE